MGNESRGRRSSSALVEVGSSNDVSEGSSPCSPLATVSEESLEGVSFELVGAEVAVAGSDG